MNQAKSEAKIAAASLNKTLVIPARADAQSSLETALMHAGRDPIEALLEAWKSEAERWLNFSKRWVTGGMVVPIGLSQVWYHALAPQYGGLAFLGFVLFPLAGRAVAERLARKLRIKPIAYGLSMFDDARILGPLLDGLVFEKRNAREMLLRSLLRILPLVETEHLASLSERHWAALNHFLLIRPDSALKLDLIKGVTELSARTANRRLAGGLKKLAAGRYAASTHSELQAAAAEALLQIPAAPGRKKALPTVIE